MKVCLLAKEFQTFGYQACHVCAQLGNIFLSRVSLDEDNGTSQLKAGVICNVQLQKISTLSPTTTEGIGISLGVAWGFPKTKKFKEMYGTYLEFPERYGHPRKYPFHGGNRDIFWNYTIMA